MKCAAGREELTLVSHATRPMRAFSITQVSVMPWAYMPNRPMPFSDQRSPVMLGLTPDLSKRSMKLRPSVLPSSPSRVRWSRTVSWVGSE